MQITVEREGRNPALDLERFFQRIARPGRGEIRKIADAITMGFSDNFTSESSALGPWRELHPRTQVQRARLGYASKHPMLVRTHQLRDAWTDRGSPDHIERLVLDAGGWALEAGTKGELSNRDPSSIPTWMEYGVELRDGVIPPRPVSPLTAKSEQRIGSTIAYVLDQIERSTLKR